MRDAADSTDLVHRIARLERSNRRVRLGLGLAAGLAVVLAFRPAVQDTVAAHRFVLIDSAGAERGRWDADDSGKPTFRVGQLGEGRAYTSVTKGGVTISNFESDAADSLRADVVMLTRAGLHFIRRGAFMPLALNAGRQTVNGLIGPNITIATPDHGSLVLGRTQLTTERTGFEEVRAASSLVMLNRKGEVIWKAP